MMPLVLTGCLLLADVLSFIDVDNCPRSYQLILRRLT